MFAVAAFGIYLELGGDAPWWIPNIAVDTALVPWFVIGFLDVNGQRRIGYREPPRYSDSDY